MTKNTNTCRGAHCASADYNTRAVNISDISTQSFAQGEVLLLSGTIYTARDAAHKRMCESLAKGEALPIDVSGQLIYYCGPTPTPPGKAIGSCGPTTSARMNKYAPILINAGLSAIMGKGSMSDDVYSALRKSGGIYLSAIGGAGAYYANCVKSCRIVAYEDLLSEAIHELTIQDFPAIVVIS